MANIKKVKDEISEVVAKPIETVVVESTEEGTGMEDVKESVCCECCDCEPDTAESTLWEYVERDTMAMNLPGGCVISHDNAMVFVANITYQDGNFIRIN